MPMLNTLMDNIASMGVKEIVFGMAHRGRLNVLKNVLKKPLKDICLEFEDQNIFSSLGSGDVKYHLGFESTFTNLNGESVDISLAPNPSHLEFICPVVEGIVRAKPVSYTHLTLPTICSV